jgi:hypothetical protein
MSVRPTRHTLTRGRRQGLTGAVSLRDNAGRPSAARAQLENTGNAHVNGRSLRHIPAVALFALLACVWSYPLVLQLGTAVPGAGAGDNLTSLWNVWWMRRALELPDTPFFFTSYIFAPFGADLTLHTHTALLGWVAGTLLHRVALVPAFNLLILGSLCLNATCTYVLAYQISRHRGASIVAALVFGGSPYVMAHLHGHLNLLAAWGLPLFAACVHRASRSGSQSWYMAAGASLAAVAYTDYYYFVYCLVFALLYVPRSSVAVSLSRHAPRRWSTESVLLGLFLAALATAAAISVTGGWTLDIEGVHISMKRPTNTLTVAWLLLALLLWIRSAPSLHINREDSWPLRDVRALCLGALVVLIGTLPLLVAGTRLWHRGDYVSPPRTWRSSAPGVDVLSLLTGNPFHPVWGSAVRHVHDAIGIDPIEGVAWLGLVPLALLVRDLSRRQTHDPDARRWWTVGGVFLLWSLGPFLVVGGINTGLVLPAALVKFVPIVANARIPSRAIVFVYLALAILLSKVLAALPGTDTRRAVVCCILGAVVLVDFGAVPFPMYPLAIPKLYEALEQSPDRQAILLELPLGIRDGFGETGRLDHSVLYFQTLHEHPMVGGFVARMSRRLKDVHLSDPALGPLLMLSGDKRINGRPAQNDAPMTIGNGLRRLGIRYIVLNRDTAPSALAQVVDRMCGVTRVARDGARELFTLGPCRAETVSDSGTDPLRR